jgi:hypothetical protein
MTGRDPSADRCLVLQIAEAFAVPDAPATSAQRPANDDTLRLEQVGTPHPPQLRPRHLAGHLTERQSYAGHHLE